MPPRGDPPHPPGIAHLCVTFGFGGAERVAAHLALRALARGDSARVLVPRGGAAEAGLRHEGLAVEGPRAAHPDLPNAPDALRFALDTLVRARGDLVHAHLPWPDRLGTALLARGLRPCVVTFHLLAEHVVIAPDIALGPRAPIAALVRASARLAPLVLVALTETDRARLASAFPTARVEVVPNAPLPPAGADPGPLPFGPGTRLLAVGRLTPQKGFDRLLRALAAEPARSLPWSLFILGEGDERRALRALTRDLGLAPRVHLPGPWPAGYAYPQADLFLTTSRSEGMPLTLLEAMSAATAPLASPIPPHRLLLEAIPGALLPDDPTAWPTALARLLTDPPARAAIAAAAAAHVRSTYGPAAQDAAYAALYRTLPRVERPRPPR